MNPANGLNFLRRAKLARRLYLIWTLMTLVSLACGLTTTGPQPTQVLTAAPALTATRSLQQPTPVPTKASTITPLPPKNLPPALVEADPLPGSQLALKGAVTLSFNQAMDKLSVEGAIKGQPPLSGKFTWTNDSTLVFKPDQPFLPAANLSLTVAISARAVNGLPLTQPGIVHYTTPDALKLTQFLPVDAAKEVDPASAVVASFNQPVVALGASADLANQPSAFSLTPSAQGKGEWINTSTYIFYPQPALAGGAAYTVTISPGLTSVAGASLDSKSLPSWSFTTAVPRVVKVDPSGAPLRLDGPLSVTFNIAMDQASVEAAFSLFDPAQNRVTGKTSWNDRGTLLSFTPSGLLARGTVYQLSLKGPAASRGGTPLGKDMTVNVNTYPELAITASVPQDGQSLANLSSGFGSLSLNFNSLLAVSGLEKYFTFTPPVYSVSAYQDPATLKLNLAGFFQAKTAYTLAVSSDLPDAWGQPLSKPFQMAFKTPDNEPGFTIPALNGSSVVFLTPQDKSLQAQVVNLTTLAMTLTPLSPADFFKLSGPQGYDLLPGFTGTNSVRWTYKVPPSDNSAEVAVLPISPDGQPLKPGYYALAVVAPELQGQGNGQPSSQYLLLAVSPLQLTFKLSADQALVWAADIRGGGPVGGASVSILDESGQVLGGGKTGDNGVASITLPRQDDPYRTFYAVVGQPGDDHFGISLSSWNQGLNAYDFGLQADYSSNATNAYIYTDRPIYRPGQTVYYRAILRERDNGRYKLPAFSQVTVTIVGDGSLSGQAPVYFDSPQPLSAFGDLHGSLALPADAIPGYYQITISQDKKDISSLGFQVANYHKPQVDLNVAVAPQALRQGDDLQAKVTASYFFGAPAVGLKLHWALFGENQTFDLPGYQVGPEDTSWLLPRWAGSDYGGLGAAFIAQGDDQTGADGSLSLHFTSKVLVTVAPESLQKLTLEVTITDDSGSPVSARASALRHPAAIYIGARPDAWNSQAGSAIGFDLQAVDTLANPAGGQALDAVFERVSWTPQDTTGLPGLPSYMQQVEPIAKANPVTDGAGRARLSFTPDNPGAYMLDIKGGGAHSQVLLWVGGEGQMTWPDLPEQRIHLTADQPSYQPGQTARVFIPNPFHQKVYALVTVERSRVMQASVLSLEGSGVTYTLPLTDAEAPNVFISVTVLGQTPQGRPDFRQGYVALQVEPSAETLKVSLTLDPPHAAPGQKVTASIQVADALGKPVQGSFSLSAVDLALLKLADPNAPDILDNYYSPQPLGPRTSLSLAGYGWRALISRPGGGRGGGGGSGVPVLRQNFQDTAFWSAEILTGADGKAQVSFTLPDNLTTWQLDLRGLTSDTLVGEARDQIVTSKELMVIPETPSFLTAGDHAELAAVVYNNTSGDLPVTVELQAAGADLDPASPASVVVALPAKTQKKVAWWVTAQAVDQVSLVFKAKSGPLSDASTPETGALPVVAYTAPQTFSTSGLLTEGGDHLEVISLPQSVKAQGGSLTLELSPSLGAVVLRGIEAISTSPEQDTSTLLSRFLPELEAALALRGMGVKAPTLENSLDSRVKTGLTNLLNRQNPDGGWTWYPAIQTGDVKSDAYLTAYCLIGLSQASQAGFTVSADTIQRASKFLVSNLNPIKRDLQSWELDSLAFQLYAVQRAGSDQVVDAGTALYAQRQGLSPWGRAFLALTLNSQLKGDAPVMKDLVNELESSGLRTATSLHWEQGSADWRLPDSPVLTTAVVLYALGQLDPAAPGLSDALIYLMAQRSSTSAWSSPYETAWVLMALTQILKGTGDLQASYAFSAALNDTPVAKGQAGGPNTLTSVTASLPVASLSPTAPNALVINREAGPGGLYYRADLKLDLPAGEVQPLQQGLSLERAYYPSDCKPEVCAPVHAAALGTGPVKPIAVHLTLTLPNAMYHVLVQDAIPAGTAIFNPALNTSSQSLLIPQPGVDYDPANPYAMGWGGWWFNAPALYTDHILWSADYLPAGTYDLVYTLVPFQAGEYRAVPARAWQLFFPEVQGSSAGDIFKVTQ